MDFVKDLESSIDRKLDCVDIGGGLSTTYKDSEEPDGFAYQRYLYTNSTPPVPHIKRTSWPIPKNDKQLEY